MLVDDKGKVVDFRALPKHRAAREAALAKLKEISTPRRKGHSFFRLDARATIKE